MSAVADIQECRDFLAANPQVKFVEVFFTSMTGVPRGKRLRVHELEAIYEYGRFLPGSVLVVDTNGADCEDTGLVWEDGDADRRARPVPGTLTLAPWLGPDVAQVMLSLYELDGTPNDLDPRHVLQRVLDRYAADGLTPVAACELEYYLVDLQRGPNGELLPAKSLQTGLRPSESRSMACRNWRPMPRSCASCGMWPTPSACRWKARSRSSRRPRWS